jgi:UDP-N-acetylglucosamine 4,6-dehydratase
VSHEFKNAVVTITGGTGSFGSTMVRDLLENSVNEVRILSRDENKQDNMRKAINDERVRFFIGDVRDQGSVDNAIKGSDYVFHAAALKQVPSCEFFPMQAVATNILGSANVVEASFKHEVKAVVCLSTDKAVYPINAMGMSKALMEKTAQSISRNNPNSVTKVAITRYGNVMMSRGSVIPLFIDQIRSGKPITITDGSMTRFMMSLQDSVSLVKYAFLNADSGDLFVKKAPACTVDTLVRAVAEIFQIQRNLEIQIIGTRHGEKLFESLLGTEERARAIDCGDYFRVPLDTRSLDYQIYFEKGQEQKSSMDAYTSHNTSQLNVNEVIDLLRQLPEFKKYVEEKSKL